MGAPEGRGFPSGGSIAGALELGLTPLSLEQSLRMGGGGVPCLCYLKGVSFMSGVAPSMSPQRFLLFRPGLEFVNSAQGVSCS